LRITVILVFLFFQMVFGEWIKVEGIPNSQEFPVFDGEKDNLWDRSVDLLFRGEIRGLSLLKYEENLLVLLKMEKEDLRYVGKSYYLDFYLGKRCGEDGFLMRVPLKVWNGRAYLFRLRGEKRMITGFFGVGLGRFLEITLPFPNVEKSELCVVLLDSRTLETLEKHELVLYFSSNERE